jgi:hypothetical protein
MEAYMHAILFRCPRTRREIKSGGLARLFSIRARCPAGEDERDKMRIIQFGDVYVTPDGGELGQVKWAW